MVLVVMEDKSEAAVIVKNLMPQSDLYSMDRFVGEFKSLKQGVIVRKVFMSDSVIKVFTLDAFKISGTPFNRGAP